MDMLKANMAKTNRENEKLKEMLRRQGIDTSNIHMGGPDVLNDIFSGGGGNSNNKNNNKKSSGTSKTDSSDL